MFLLLPLKTDSKLQSAPWANWALIAANIAVFAITALSSSETFAGWALNSQRPELHQFISYAFLHAGIWHLVGNMIFLYIFGNNICDKLGNLSYIAFYLAGAVFSGIGYVAINQGGMVVGASGAVAAVTGAYLALLPRSRITMFYWLFILIGVYEVPSLWVIGIFFLQDVFSSFSPNSNVAHIAHVSGSIFGFLVCLLLLKTRILARDQFDMVALIDRWNRRRQYQSVVRDGYDPFGNSPRSAGLKSAASLEMDQMQDLRAQISEALAQGKLPLATALYTQLRGLDANQTMSRGTQLDLANQFYATGDYQSAADAYELFLKSYGTSEQAGQVALMLGLAYGRYLNQPAKAVENLRKAINSLHFSREHDIAKAELLRLENAGA